MSFGLTSTPPLPTTSASTPPDRATGMLAHNTQSAMTGPSARVNPLTGVASPNAHMPPPSFTSGLKGTVTSPVVSTMTGLSSHRSPSVSASLSAGGMLPSPFRSPTAGSPSSVASGPGLLSRPLSAGAPAAVSFGPVAASMRKLNYPQP